MTATRVAKWSTLVALAVGWVVAAWLLTRTTIPGNLHEPHVSAAAEFQAPLLHRSARYDSVLRWLWVAGTLATLAALVVFTKLGPRIAAAWQLGRVAKGIMVGTVTTLGTWAVTLPVGAVALWWGRRYQLEKQDYVTWVLAQWPSLVSQVVGLTIALTILLLLAGRFGKRWWLVAAPLFTVLGGVLVLVLPYVESIGTRQPHQTAVYERIRQLAREEGVGSTPIRIETVSDETRSANAYTTGIGPSARVFIWDTFFDGRFTNREIELVAAHEFGHVAHRHIWKGLAWSLLLTLPAFLVVELATRRRGGLQRPELVPYALLVLALIGLVITPLGNAVSRRYEAEADWSALRATHDPGSAESLFRKFTRYDLVQPNPPLWSYLMLDNHPTVVQRIALARAYRERAR
ncbi:MAG TPA: M48 family metalloprotease [Gaiellaceae bacterium]|jgi:STE24 endopeptidase|nr:M48 family metalloprotease [Gaiellaceae bacterium]